MRNVLKISPDDSVAVALPPLKAGDAIEVDGKAITLLDDIPAGHKVALNAMHKGEHVIKYGFPIGEAKTDIPQGSHVHVHNLRTLLSGELEYQYHPHGKPLAARPAATFAGYPRRDGRVGVRNELWILPTVGCVNDVARALERRAQTLVGEEWRAYMPSRIRMAVPRWGGSGEYPLGAGGSGHTSQRGRRAAVGAGLRKQRR